MLVLGFHFHLIVAFWFTLTVQKLTHHLDQVDGVGDEFPSRCGARVWIQGARTMFMPAYSIWMLWGNLSRPEWGCTFIS